MTESDRIGWGSTVQYSTVQYSTVQYSTVQYSTVQDKMSIHAHNYILFSFQAHSQNASNFKIPFFHTFFLILKPSTRCSSTSLSFCFKKTGQNSN